MLETDTDEGEPHQRRRDHDTFEHIPHDLILALSMVEQRQGIVLQNRTRAGGRYHQRREVWLVR